MRGNTQNNGCFCDSRLAVLALRQGLFRKNREGWPELRKSVRSIVSAKLDEETLRRAWNRDERLHIEGLGANQIMKILTAAYRQKWPVLNKRSWNVMMDYGYRIEWSAAEI